jgi:hypothetical protein
MGCESAVMAVGSGCVLAVTGGAIGVMAGGSGCVFAAQDRWLAALDTAAVVGVAMDTVDADSVAVDMG